MTAAQAAYPELEALQAQCRELARLLDELEPSDWDRETRCPPLSVRELATHVGAVLPIWASFHKGDAPDKATTDRVQWWRYDAQASAPRIVERAQRMAAEHADDEIPGWFRTNADEALRTFASTPPGRLVARSEVALTAADLTCVAVVEVGIHTMDLGHATIRGERLHPLAEPLVFEVLEDLLGERFPKGLGWDERTAILTASGRRPLADPERRTLSLLADRFPVLT